VVLILCFFSCWTLAFVNFDKFLTFSVHPRVVLIVIFVANSILDISPCIFYFLILQDLGVYLVTHHIDLEEHQLNS
jgi:hypothetical protein